MFKSTMRRLTLFVLVASLGTVGLGLGGCQTVKGLGEDISNAGEAGEDAINSN